jgi:GT2 family glycosyltransferase
MSLRVLLALHHRLTPAGGAPAATLALGAALSDMGCRVDYFGYEHAFGHDSVDSMGSSLHFPWRFAAYLRRRASDFDVVDVSAGDCWVWTRRNRPTAGKAPVTIARSQQLEHTLDQWYRLQAKLGKLKLSWKYPFYHGGYRLWEVKRSLFCADHALFLNDHDREFAVESLGLSPENVSVIGHGIGRQFVGLWEPVEVPADAALKLIVIGEWTDGSSKREILEITRQLRAEGVCFSLTLLGTVADEVEVRSDFPAEAREHLRVIPQYRAGDLPEILLQHHVLIAHGFGAGYVSTLPEGMAAGLAPIAPRVGSALRLITSGTNGELTEPGDVRAMVRIIIRWAGDHALLHAIRLRAHQTAQHQDWNSIAAQTIGIYESVLRRVVGPDAPRITPTEFLSPATSIWQRSGKPALSICICTANRPKVLRRCLASIEQGESMPAEVVVGDDSLDGTETAAVCGEFSFVRYVRGPRHGLCANRNVVIAAALGDYVALLDDDSEVTPQFVRLAQELTARADGRTIFTGDVLEDGVDRVPPSNPTFWGHFGKPLAVMGQCETVHLNSNIFPRAAFKDARFDERIVYGYEDMDLCQQMLISGYRIEYRRELVNLHLPPPRTADVRRSLDEQADRARYYTSLKRYMLWQSKPIRAFAYAALAPLHQAGHHLIHKEMSQALVGFSDMSWAVHQALEFRRAARTNGSSAPILVSQTSAPPGAN